MSFNPHQWYLMGLQSKQYNLFIGNVSSSITNKTLLANKLYDIGYSTTYNANDIINFTIEGNDIKCYIKRPFRLLSATVFQDSELTYFRDYENCKGLYPFRDNANLVDIYAKECTIIYGLGGNYSQWTNSPKLDILYIPKCVNFGQTTGLDYIFRSGYGAPKNIYVDPIIATCNGGNPDSDVSVGISNGATFIYVDNFTAPNAITDLASGIITTTTIQITFTPPSSTNTIDFYEVYLDGVYYQNINASGDNIIGLNADTTYEITVRAVDIYYNKSGVSNKVIETTTL